MPADSRGSLWRRWDPHIHTPGTVLNDQFGNSPHVWEEYLSRLESATPTVEALGVTDYYTLNSYKKVCEEKAKGRLPKVELIFPNVEIRLDMGTSRGGQVNAHLLFSPEDPEHIGQIESFLGKLHFRSADETYACSRHDLIRLGRKHTGQQQLPEINAFAEGANQFKVDLDQLKELWKSSAWIAEHCIFAVAVGERDGTSGLRDSGDSLDTLRKSVEHFASIIFSGKPADVSFWLGRHPTVGVFDLEEKWGGIKPCLHGSDAHSLERVLSPDHKRFCWIKGDLAFETLRHVCMEPETRVHVGESHPELNRGSRSVLSVSVSNAEWMSPQNVPLNPGLVAVIGARGSGKTALADLIAAGGLSVSDHLHKNSFLLRARGLLGSGRVELTWSEGEVTSNGLASPEVEDFWDSPRVQYLSQQFVDQLCSADGPATGLTKEIHRVLFNAHGVDEREGTTSFDDLLKLRLAPAEAKHETFAKSLQLSMENLSRERARKVELPKLEKQKDDLIKQVEQDEKERLGILGTGGGQEERANRHREVQVALESRRRSLDSAQSTARSLKGLADDVQRFRVVEAKSIVSQWMQSRESAGLTPEEWGAFSLRFEGDVDSVVRVKLEEAEERIQQILGVPLVKDPQRDVQLSWIPENQSIQEQTIAVLSAEIERLNSSLGIDRQNNARLTSLSTKISKAKKDIELLDAQIELAKTADVRIKQHLDERAEFYKETFQAVSEIELEYRRLYSPLERSLREQSQASSGVGSLGKLGVLVKRTVNVEAWAERGEHQLDLRKQGPFKGRGALLQMAKSALLNAWEKGTASEVAAAMQAFIQENETKIKEHRPDDVDVKQWTSSVLSWLFDTSHVSISYALTFDGVEIERLSPGTRGVVLLLLYLSIDQEDDRPLIIDQPEENLDPKSVYDELVHRFRSVRERRQVIIVTHNANLVVNTDVDQVIVAEATAHTPGKLPQINYQSGGLENRQIRKHVCDVLEGGERAFRDRAKRLRLKLSDTYSLSTGTV